MSEPPDLIGLHGRGVSLALERQAEGAPLWRHWGARLADEFRPGPGLAASRPKPSFSLDEVVAFTVFPTFGLGWFGQSALLAHRDGADFAQRFQRCDVEWLDPNCAVRLLLHDDVAGVRVAVDLALDVDTDVLTLSTRLTNTGAGVLDVSWLAAAALPLPAGEAVVRSFSGRHNSEFVAQEERPGRALWRKENRRGLTSHDSFPGAVVGAPRTADDAGPAFGAQLAWSGNAAQSVEWLDDGRRQWQLGEWLAPGEVRLGSGESLQGPQVLATFSDAGWNGVAANFHAAMRKRVCWPGGKMAARPVHLNTWEGLYFDHDLTRLKAIADAAAAIGVERFVLDDGWFHGRDDDTTSLGDWRVDARKYPAGLRPLVDHVTGLGMGFGLWVEPEMVNPDSDLFRAHPEWALQLAGRTHQTARRQLVLDLSRPAVGDYLFETIGGLLDELPIEYLKWDHNRDLVAAGGADGRVRYRAQVEAAYQLFARFRDAFPHVEIEACAGGGGRIDAGIARFTHRFWTSDNLDAVSRAAMQPGFLQFMPPELMGSHVGAAPAHGTSRSQSLDFRAAVACQGHFGVELDPTRLDPEERARLAEWIEFYKAHRHLLHGQVRRGDLGDGAVWHAAGDGQTWLMIVYRIQPMQQRHTNPAKLRFLDPATAYSVEPVGPGAAGEAMTFDGSWLREVGLPIWPRRAETAAIYRIAPL